MWLIKTPEQTLQNLQEIESKSFRGKTMGRTVKLNLSLCCLILKGLEFAWQHVIKFWKKKYGKKSAQCRRTSLFFLSKWLKFQALCTMFSCYNLNEYLVDGQFKVEWGSVHLAVLCLALWWIGSIQNNPTAWPMMGDEGFWAKKMKGWGMCTAREPEIQTF